MTEDDKNTGKDTDAAADTAKDPGAPKPAEPARRAGGGGGGGATRRARRTAPTPAPPSPTETPPAPTVGVTGNPLAPLPARRPSVWPD